jgi:DNA-binding transcriptional ArsR family regulator
MSVRSNKEARTGSRGRGQLSMVQSNEALANIFAALGDPTRLKLVAALCAGGAFSIAQLTVTTEMSRQGITKHLQVLGDAGIVRDVKLGRERLWQLEPAQIEEAKRTLEMIGRQWETALGNLKSFAESLE